jgi:mannose-6-phosphate isomerase-like protein (cupin superfamily)
MRPVIDKSTAQYYTWGKDCTSWIFVNTPGLSVKQELMPAGAEEQSHYHEKAGQFFYILKGEAIFYGSNEELGFKERQGFFVHPGEKHSIKNPGPEILEFLVISQPPTDDDRINL